jgi:hypothetical protein
VGSHPVGLDPIRDLTRSLFLQWQSERRTEFPPAFFGTHRAGSKTGFQEQRYRSSALA